MRILQANLAVIFGICFFCSPMSYAELLGQKTFGKEKWEVTVSTLSAEGKSALQTQKKQHENFQIPTPKHLAEPLALNKLTTLYIEVKPQDPKKALEKFKLVGFDARMPEHNHGMVVKAEVENLKEGVYLIEGFKLHMPGDWVLYLQLQDEKGKDEKLMLPLNQKH